MEEKYHYTKEVIQNYDILNWNSSLKDEITGKTLERDKGTCCAGSLDIRINGSTMYITSNGKRHNDSTRILFKSFDEAVEAAKRIENNNRLESLATGGFQFPYFHQGSYKPSVFDYRKKELDRINNMSIEEMKSFLLSGKTPAVQTSNPNAYFFDADLLKDHIKFVETPQIMDYELRDNKYTSKIKEVRGYTQYIPCWNVEYENDYKDIDVLLLKNIDGIIDGIKRLNLKYLYALTIKFSYIIEGIMGMEYIYEGIQND